MDIRNTLDRLRGSSARPDGWTGTEVAEAIFATDALAAIFNHCELLAVLPSGGRVRALPPRPRSRVSSRASMASRASLATEQSAFTVGVEPSELIAPLRTGGDASGGDEETGGDDEAGEGN